MAASFVAAAVVMLPVGDPVGGRDRLAMEAVDSV